MLLHNSHVQQYKRIFGHNFRDYKKTYYEHSKERALERYNFILTPRDYDYMLNLLIGRDSDINKPFVKFIKQNTKNKSVWEVQYKGKWFIVGFLNCGKKKKLITTFLPRNKFYGFEK